MQGVVRDVRRIPAESERVARLQRAAADAETSSGQQRRGSVPWVIRANCSNFGLTRAKLTELLKRKRVGAALRRIAAGEGVSVSYSDGRNVVRVYGENLGDSLSVGKAYLKIGDFLRRAAMDRSKRALKRALKEMPKCYLR